MAADSDDRGRCEMRLNGAIWPFCPASREFISRWIVDAFQAAGPEALLAEGRAKAHDTRSISTSWSLFQGVGLDDILKATFWQSPNSFTSFYLRDVPSGDVLFATASLRAASAAIVPQESPSCSGHAS